jgi:hypothetical protein
MHAQERLTAAGGSSGPAAAPTHCANPHARTSNHGDAFPSDRPEQTNTRSRRGASLQGAAQRTTWKQGTVATKATPQAEPRCIIRVRAPPPPPPPPPPPVSARAKECCSPPRRPRADICAASPSSHAPDLCQPAMPPAAGDVAPALPACTGCAGTRHVRRQAGTEREGGGRPARLP